MRKLKLFVVLMFFALIVSLDYTAVAGVIPVTIDTSVLADKGQVVVKTDLSSIFPLGQGRMEAVLSPAAGKPEVYRKTFFPGVAKTRLSFSMLGLPDGDYTVSVTVRDEKSAEVAQSEAVNFSWKKPDSSFTKSPNLKVLNNLVVELYNLKDDPFQQNREVTFTNPYEGWVFFSCTAGLSGKDKVAVTLDGASEKEAVIILDNSCANPAEAMRYLSKGEHRIRIASDGKPVLNNFIVRAIPELIYTQFNENSSVSEYGPYDWAYLQKHIFRNVNAMTTVERALKPARASNDITQIYRERMEWWKDQGKKWIFVIGLPGSGGEESAAVERIYKGWHDYLGLYPRFADGIIVDEFGGSENDLNVNYPVFAKAIDKLYQDPKLAGKKVYIDTYASPMVLAEPSKLFAETVIKHNGNFSLEWYPNEQADWNNLAANLSVYRLQAATWEKGLPGSIRHLISNLSYASTPEYWSSDVESSVDFKVHMDMYMNMLANDPAFFGLYGVRWYSAAAANEEYVRWGSRLFRHYCIEGKTNLLSDELGYKYHLTHIVNPDFKQGLTGWDVTTVEDGSTALKSVEGYGFLEGRYLDHVNADGDAFVWMKRGAKKPNILAQNIVNLTPGRLYSVKMITTDYQNLVTGKSEYAKHAVSLRIDNADIVEKRSFQQVMHARTGWPGLTPAAKKLFPAFNSYFPVWLNLYQTVFQAKGNQARLIISDWLNDKEPGGPTGQELMVNSIEVQPYYDED